MAKIEIKEEPVVDELELRYREDPPEIDNSVQYYQVGSISDQVRAICGENCMELEVKQEATPKVEPIEIDPNRQVVIKLDRDFIQKYYRTKWVNHVSSTFRHRAYVKACQLCSKLTFFDSPKKLIKHYKECHQKETTLYNCSICYYSTKRQHSNHWERKNHHGLRSEPLSTEKYTVSKIANDPKMIWIGDDELVRSMFFKEPFECKICKKVFSVQVLLNNHNIMNHSDESEIKLHRCDQCNKTFRLKNNLRMHKKNVHEEEARPWRN